MAGDTRINIWFFHSNWQDKERRILETESMNLTVEIPDDLASRLNATGGDLSRRALEAFGLEEYKSGHISKADLRRLLGFASRYELDGFLKTHEVWIDYTVDDFRRELDDLKRLGF